MDNNNQENTRRAWKRELRSLFLARRGLLFRREFHSENVEAPCNPVDRAITRQFANRLCSQEGKGGGGGRGKREIVGLTHTQRRHNCERRRVTRVGSRRSPWSLAAGYAFVQQAFIPGRCATYAIVNASVSLFPPARFQYVVHILDGFARTRISASRRRAAMVRYRCNFPRNYEGSCCVVVSLEFNEIIFSCAIRHARFVRRRKCIS